MRGTAWSLLLGVAVLALWLARPAARVSAGAVSCVQVISRVNHAVGKEGGRLPDMSLIARHLGTSPAWVEHCMRVYGRRPKRPGLEAAEAHEERLEEFEEAEPEESAPEDVEEFGARERPSRPEKPQRMKIRPTPTVGFGEGD